MIHPVQVHKASPLRLADKRESVSLEIHKHIPTDLGSKELTALYDADAQRIVDALWSTLPGGTIDRLIARLLMRAASQLQVSRGDRPHG